jgi:hypothetical protein
VTNVPPIWYQSIQTPNIFDLRILIRTRVSTNICEYWLFLVILFLKKTKFLTYIPRTVEKRSRNARETASTAIRETSMPMEGEDRAVLEEEESVGTQGESLVDGVG